MDFEWSVYLRHVLAKVEKGVKSQRSRVKTEDSRLLTLNNRIANI